MYRDPLTGPITNSTHPQLHSAQLLGNTGDRRLFGVIEAVYVWNFPF